MIRQDNAQLAIDLAEEFDKRGLALGIKDGSFLNQLYSASTIDFVHPVVAAPDGYNPTAQDIVAESSMTSIASSEGVHEQVLDEVVLELADAVRQHVSFAKNTVRPLVKTYVEAVEVALKAMPQTASFNPEVKQMSLPAPMQSNIFESWVKPFEQVTYYPITTALGFQSKSAEEISQLMSTGVKQIDTDVAQWLQAIGSDFVVEVYTAVFTMEGTHSQAVNFSSLIDVPITGTDAALIVFLLAKHFLANPPEGLTMSLPEYRRSIDELLKQAGLRLSHAYENYARQDKSDTLIMSYSNNVVHVHADVYARWSDNGGQLAALFGNLLSDRPTYFANAINARATEYTRSWERQNQILTLALRNNRYRDTVSALKFQAQVLVAENLKQCFDSVQPGLNFDSEIVQEAMTRINEFIDSLKMDDINELWKVGTDIVAGCIFYYTDALKILNGIEQFCKENPNLDPAEAALLSSIDYIVDYACDQLYVTDI